MKTKDIVIGAEYAVGSEVAPGRAVVLAVRQERRVYARDIWDSTGHKAQDGVRVRWVGGYHADKEHVCPPGDIRRPWADQELRLAARAENDQAKANHSDRIRLLAERLTEMGIAARRGYAPRIHGAGLGRDFLEITDLDALTTLLDGIATGERFVWRDGDVEVQGV